jgi:hypothetical protein
MTFWRKEKISENGIPIHCCDKHNFRTSNANEILEHERMHAMEESGNPQEI